MEAGWQAGFRIVLCLAGVLWGTGCSTPASKVPDRNHSPDESMPSDGGGTVLPAVIPLAAGTSITVLFLDAATAVSMTQPADVGITGPDADLVQSEMGAPLVAVEGAVGQVSFTLSDDAVPSFEEPVDLAVVVKAAGYVTSSRQLRIVESGTQLFELRLVPVDSAVSGISLAELPSGEATPEGILAEDVNLTTPEDAGTGRPFELSIEAGTTITDPSGAPLQGALTAQLTYFSHLDEQALQAFPGGFSISLAADENGEPVDDAMFISGGFVSVEIHDENGLTAKNFSEPISMTVPLSPETVNPETGEKIETGDQFPIWSYNTGTAEWSYESLATVEGPDADGMFFVTFEASHLSYWNLDWKSSDLCSPVVLRIDRSPDMAVAEEQGAVYSPLPVRLNIYKTSDGSASGSGFWLSSPESHIDDYVTMIRTPWGVPLNVRAIWGGTIVGSATLTVPEGCGEIVLPIARPPAAAPVSVDLDVSAHCVDDIETELQAAGAEKPTKDPGERKFGFPTVVYQLSGGAGFNYTGVIDTEPYRIPAVVPGIYDVVLTVSGRHFEPSTIRLKSVRIGPEHTAIDAEVLYECKTGERADVRILNFNTDIVNFDAGQKPKLIWATKNATSCSISPEVGAVPLKGSVEIEPADTTTYTLACEGQGGPVSRQVTVFRKWPVEILKFTSTKDEVLFGRSARLEWEATHAFECRLSPGIGPVATSGVKTVWPSSSTEYTLSCTGNAEGASAVRPVSVYFPGSIDKFEASPSLVEVGTPVTLSWETTFAAGCTIEPGFGDVPEDGSVETVPETAGTTDYQLSCSDAKGGFTQTVSVTSYSPESVVIREFTADLDRVRAGGKVTLAWSVENADSCAITPGNIPASGGTGTVPVYPSATTTYQLSCTGPGGPVSETVQVKILSPGVNVACAVTDAVGTDYTNAVSSYADGSFVVAGSSRTAIVFGAGTSNEDNTPFHGGYSDMWVARYGSDCTFQWRAAIAGASEDRAVAVLAMPDGGVIVTGAVLSPVTFGTGDKQASFSGWTGYRLFFARYDIDGILKWARVMTDGTEGNSGWALALASDGGFYLGGQISAQATFGQGEANARKIAPADTSGDSYHFIAKYSSADILDWVTPVAKVRPGSTYSRSPMEIAVNSAGTVAVAGQIYHFFCIATCTYTYTLLPGLNSQPEAYQFGGSGYLTVFAPDGKELWGKHIVSNVGGSNASAVTWTPDDGIVVGGYFGENNGGEEEGAYLELQGLHGSIPLASVGTSGDLYVARFETDGDISWATTISTVSSEFLRDVFSLADGSVGVSAGLSGQTKFYTNTEYVSTIISGAPTSMLMLGPDGRYHSRPAMLPVYLEKISGQPDGSMIAVGRLWSGSVTLNPPGIVLSSPPNTNSLLLISFNP